MVTGAVGDPITTSSSGPLASSSSTEKVCASARPPRDAKTALQEWAQGRGLPTPLYREIGRSGPHHNLEFRVSVELPNLAPAEGVGRSKRAAEQAAAAVLLAREGVESAAAAPGAASTDG